MRSCRGSDFQRLKSNMGVCLCTAAPETRALDCECCAPSGASSPRRNLRDHRSQLRLVGEATGYVDGVQLVVDFHRAADLRLSVWYRADRHTEAKELTDTSKKATSQRRRSARDSLLSSVPFQQLSHAVKSIPTRWNLSQQHYLKPSFDRICLCPLTELVWLLCAEPKISQSCALWVPNLTSSCRSLSLRSHFFSWEKKYMQCVSSGPFIRCFGSDRVRNSMRKSCWLLLNYHCWGETSSAVGSTSTFLGSLCTPPRRLSR